MSDHDVHSIKEKAGADFVEDALPQGELEYGKKEARLVAKLDWFLAPILGLLTLVSFLDRGNIGYAATQGMVIDIGLVGSQLNIAISIFYIFYILAEIPSSILVKRLQFNRVIPTENGFIQNFASLVACRLLLGLFEGVLFPSSVLLMANWYKREELGVRISYLYIAAALSSAFGGLIAFGILYMDGTAGYPGWRWLYIIEGLITVVIAFFCYYLIPKDYQTAYFLNDEDRRLMRRRAELTESYNGGQGHYTRKDFLMAVKDSKTWLHGFMQFACMTVVYGFSVFLPIILKTGFNYSTKAAQYLAIPVFLWGALTYAVGGFLSDRYQRRFLAVFLSAPFGIIGYCILLASSRVSVGVQYFSCFLISTAIYLCAGGNMAWLSMNSAPDGKRAAAVGITLTLTNVGGIVSGQIYVAKQAPHYRLGHAWSLASLVLAWIGWCIVRYVYNKRESWKEKAVAEGIVVPPEDFSDRAPGYRYQL
ncbi:retrograde regulation protein 2 [Zopfia rhizophila CBS 207.26]|uniref:Retrograde regulation protein 2 n=1 Tax=Zopfia rhizophila CBS 207.26 TaxID=1314779 RepID=A0A6A6ESU5_9PEZI|nr:retrograde regulation protein 2 [Zopfia rhizophila CBS 207.26]